MKGSGSGGIGGGFWVTVTVFDSTKVPGIVPDTVMIANLESKVEGFALFADTLIIASEEPLKGDKLSQVASPLTLQLVFEIILKVLSLPAE